MTWCLHFNILKLLCIYYVYVKNCEGSAVLPYLESNKLVCHSFRLAERRLLGWRKKDFYSQHSTQYQIPIFIDSFCPPSPMRLMWSDPGWCCIQSGLCHSWGTLSLRNPFFIKRILANLSNFVPEEEIISIILGRKQICPHLRSEKLSVSYDC